MKIHEIKDKKGRVFAFEVENFFIGRPGVCKVVMKIPKSRIVRYPSERLTFREEFFCEFIVGGKRFEVWEPFGDNSRYWIGPKPPKWCKQIEIVKKAFLDHSPLKAFFGLG